MTEAERKRLLREWRASTPDLSTAEGVAAERARIINLGVVGVLDDRTVEVGLDGLASVLRGVEVAERARRRGAARR